MQLLRRIFSNKSTSVPRPQKSNLSLSALFEKYDIFYICFDEPNRQIHWNRVWEIFPKAKKVEGVVGFDQALKTCAQQALTSHFFVIDGDNWLTPHSFDRALPFDHLEDSWVLSWASRNPINGLCYGNGGLKLWPKQVALDIRSHESADHGSDPTDYCFLADYYLIDHALSETHINHTAKQAFRAGFREGVKMSLVWGQQVRLSADQLSEQLGSQNMGRLLAWCEFGADVKNGVWAILGARMGLYYNLVECFEYQKINSFSWIDETFEKQVLSPLNIDLSNADSFSFNNQQLYPQISLWGEKLNKALGLNLRTLSPIESLRIKRQYKNPRRQGLLKSFAKADLQQNKFHQ